MYAHMYVFWNVVCTCVRACVRACVCACVCACVGANGLGFSVSWLAVSYRIYTRGHRVSVGMCERTQTGTQTHRQAPMSANESLFKAVMPLPIRSSEPPSVAQEPVRTSGTPSKSPEKTQPPNWTLQRRARPTSLHRPLLSIPSSVSTATQSAALAPALSGAPSFFLSGRGRARA